MPSCVCMMSILIVIMRILYELNGGKWGMISSCSSGLAFADENGAGECSFSCNARGAAAADDFTSCDSNPHDNTSDVYKSTFDVSLSPILIFVCLILHLIAEFYIIFK